MESISQAMNKLGIRALAYDKIKQKAKSKLLLLAFAENKRGIWELKLISILLKNIMFRWICAIKSNENKIEKSCAKHRLGAIDI